MQSINRSVMVSMVLLLALTFASMTFVAVPAQSQDKLPGKITGNVAIHSMYIFRGGIESRRPVMSGGLDYSHPSGLYAGYWGSSLGGEYFGNMDDPVSENDFYAGYANSLGPLSYDVGVTVFTYLNSTTQQNEANLSLGYGPVSYSGAYALNQDGMGFEAKGNINHSLSVSQELISDLTLSATGQYLTYGGDSDTTESDWDAAIVGISHPIGDSPASMSLQYVATNPEVHPGTGNQVVWNVSYGFDVAK